MSPGHDDHNQPAPLAAPGSVSEVQWLAGDHHVHTQYSADGMYRVIDHARHARAYGLDWLVITDHGGREHSRIGVDTVHPEIMAARAELPDLLVFQGLEWNIPNADHGTVFVSPGPNEVVVLKEFEQMFDRSLMPPTNTPAQNEAMAVAGITFLGERVRERQVEAALMLANHPSHKGLDSPHELRNWHDADPSVAIGMEGAPGHQASAIPKPHGFGRVRGYYYHHPTAASFPGYPLESYRSWGGFDWMTSTVGGMWDSLLAEGRCWWITASSDSHTVHLDSARPNPDSDFAANGRNDDPLYSQEPAVGGDFWPGFYSRTHVGATEFGYRAVMDGMRAGRIWVDHGGLVESIDARVRVTGAGPGSGAILGGTLTAQRGTPVELALEIKLPTTPNWAQFIPRVARVDLILGQVTGPAADRGAVAAPQTRVVTSFEVSPGARELSVCFALGPVDQPYYLRLRGTDGNRTQVGLMGAGVDPCGPAMDVEGDQDPWTDLWFYTNPIWVLPR